MITLPSVNASVVKVVLNENATKALIKFDDGSKVIVSTNNTPHKKVTSTIARTPNSIVMKKKIKKVVTHESGMPQYREVKTRTGTVHVPMQQADPATLAQRAQSVIKRSEKRAELLEQQTMDASTKAALQMADGAEITLS